MIEDIKREARKWKRLKAGRETSRRRRDIVATEKAAWYLHNHPDLFDCADRQARKDAHAALMQELEAAFVEETSSMHFRS